MGTSARQPASRGLFAAIVATLVLLTGLAVGVVAQNRRDFDVVARRYNFSVNGVLNGEIRVGQNDLVHITFSTEDIPHSFAIEDRDGSAYRVMRRADPGKPTTFDFRADKPGRFRFYCSLTIDDKCRDMNGTFVVDAK